MEPRKYVSIVGNVGRDPEHKSTRAGDVISFSVAVSEGLAKLDPGTQKLEVPTRWYRVSVWDEALQSEARKFVRGDRIAVKGTLKVSEWQGKTTEEVSAVALAAVGTWTWRTTKGGTPPQAPKPVDDDLPF